MSASSGFPGFSRRALVYFEGVERDNSRDYWAAHKREYEAEVRAPMDALLAELEEEFGTGKQFRPHRDVRFSPDKTPLKEHVGALVGSEGVGYYVQLDSDGLLVGGGFRSHGSQQVQRFRRAVDADGPGAELERLLAAVQADGFELEGEQLKATPRGYRADHPRIELLRCRSLMLTQRLGRRPWLTTDRAADEVRQAWRTMRPVAAWAQEHVAG